MEALSYNVDDDMDLARYYYSNRGTWKGCLKYTHALFEVNPTFWYLEHLRTHALGPPRNTQTNEATHNGTAKQNPQSTRRISVARGQVLQNSNPVKYFHGGIPKLLCPDLR